VAAARAAFSAAIKRLALRIIIWFREATLGVVSTLLDGLTELVFIICEGGPMESPGPGTGELPELGGGGVAEVVVIVGGTNRPPPPVDPLLGELTQNPFVCCAFKTFLQKMFEV